jgi:hypothetical protein
MLLSDLIVRFGMFDIMNGNRIINIFSSLFFIVVKENQRGLNSDIVPYAEKNKLFVLLKI